MFIAVVQIVSEKCAVACVNPMTMTIPLQIRPRINNAQKIAFGKKFKWFLGKPVYSCIWGGAFHHSSTARCIFLFWMINRSVTVSFFRRASFSLTGGLWIFQYGFQSLILYWYHGARTMYDNSSFHFHCNSLSNSFHPVSIPSWRGNLIQAHVLFDAKKIPTTFA